MHPDDNNIKENYDHDTIGKIWIYRDMDLGPVIQFAPSGWSRIYNQNRGGDILKDIYNYNSDLDFKIEVKENKPDAGKSIYLTLNESEKPELYPNSLYLDAKRVITNSEEGINNLQFVWKMMISRFNEASYALYEQLHPEGYQIK